MSRLEQAQEIAHRAGSAEYTREYARCIEAGIDAEEAEAWAAENASYVYDRVLDEALEAA